MPALDTLLKDPSLAPEGLPKIDFAASRMPVLAAVAEELARTRPLAGHRIAACLHVTTETANRYGSGQSTLDGILWATNIL